VAFTDVGFVMVLAPISLFRDDLRCFRIGKSTVRIVATRTELGPSFWALPSYTVNDKGRCR
jgi:hypothetical protein